MGFLISGLSRSYLQSMLGTVFESGGLASNTTRSASSTNAPSVSQTPEVNQPSPFAVLLDTLQQLQQSNPSEYSQVTEQIATNLTNAAQAAQSTGNTTAASALSQLAGDFSSAAQNNQLPSIQDLAQAVHLHRHHSQPSSSSSDSTVTAAGSSVNASNGSANQALSQMLAAFQTDASQNDSLNPMSIILNTLSSAGMGGSVG
jgi:ribosomal protein L22